MLKLVMMLIDVDDDGLWVTRVKLDSNMHEVAQFLFVQLGLDVRTPQVFLEGHR
eukprot:m.27452 g.27452  ORF g.27452 m.27452 type:complete len:54 (+) comp15748_c1_seq1:215-376(+)